ncbi:MAG: hypothetical protein H3C51_12580 [Rubellimicrobium sp.]|nr:hypothetical protein [Rubellimicrobium sp.]
MASSRAGKALAWAWQRRSLARWGRATARAERAALADLRRQSGQALALRATLDGFLVRAGARLAQPRGGAGDPPWPPGADWHWRPPFWHVPTSPAGLAGAASRTRIGDGITLFHDCAESGLTLRQIQGAADGPAFALALDVLDFDGSFLSLAIDLPPGAVAGLQRRHLVGLALDLAAERAAEIFARLNIRHGPNTEQQVRELPASSGRVTVEFDLAYTRLNEKRVEAAWLDLIFDKPAMNRIVLGDLTLARYPRAEI